MTSAIATTGLTYRYPGAAAPAVDNMSFSVERGEVFGFLGPSGAGKTTTQQIIIGLLRGWTGSVNVLGIPITRWAADLYDRIGVSFELPTGYPRLTAREDLLHFANLHRRSALDPIDTLRRVDLGHAADQRLGGFSKGMRARLNLARALIHQPDVLFLDEPTSGLDPVNVELVRDVIIRQRDAGKTIFLTTHDMATAAAVCDRVAFVSEGKIVACDAPRVLELAHGRRRIRVEYRSDDGPMTEAFQLSPADPRLFDLLRSDRVVTVHTEEASLAEVFAAVIGNGS